MKINLGCGYDTTQDLIRIDSDKNCNPDILINLDDTNLILPFEDSTIQYVKAWHILEHIGDGFLKLMQELYRVCSANALIDIRVPHPNHDTFLIDPTHKRPILPGTFDLMSKKHNYREIKDNGHASTLGIMLDIDFEVIYYRFLYDSYYDSILNHMTKNDRYRLLREALNTTIEIIINLKVVK